MASIENLLHAMGALYILNLYYRNQIFDMSTIEFDNRVGSDIFSVFTYNASSLKISQYMDDNCINKLLGNNLDNSIYIIKYDDKSFREMHENFCRDARITLDNFKNSPEIINFLSENPNYKAENINTTCFDASGINLVEKILSLNHTQKNSYKKEAVINKHTNIYLVLCQYLGHRKSNFFMLHF